MNNILRLISLLLIVSLLLATQGVSSAQAQSSPSASLTTNVASAASNVVTPLNLTVSPVSISLETTPSVPVTSALKIRNNSDSLEQLRVSFATFTADETGQKPRLIEPQPTDTFMSWLTVDQPSFSVAPGEWKTLNVTFSPPADAALSYYYVVIINRDQSIQPPGETTVQGAPAVLILTTVTSPNARIELNLSSFKANFTVGEFLPQLFSVDVKNTGNVHTVPRGNIFIDGQGEKDLAVLSINPNGATILPQSQRALEVAWSDGFPVIEHGDTPGPGFKIGNTWWDFSHADRFRFGKYTAHLLMVYDNGQRDVPIESYVSFWIIPWRVIGVGLVVLLLVTLGSVSVVQKVWRWFRSFSNSPKA